jgi:DNA-directed RNA polymerase subunit RPC12/RpoP
MQLADESAQVLQSYAEWNTAAANISYILWAVGVLIALGYFLKLGATSDSKARYDYINKYEINTLWFAAIVLVLGACFYANAFVTELNLLWIVVRVFMTIAMGLIVALIIQNLLKFYYPFYIEKRLKVLRYKPRVSPKTGKAMKLLSEEEEDAYLDEGMQAEENLFSMDYDVWKDEETGFIKIEKYSGHLHAIQCPECNYQTFKVVREEIIKAPTATEEGELLKHYQCGYCGHKARKTVMLKQSLKLEGAAAATA